MWIGELWHEFVRNNLIDELKGKDRIHYMDSMRAVMQNSSQEEFFERIKIKRPSFSPTAKRLKFWMDRQGRHYSKLVLQ